jgi:hypothetical protein
MRMIKMLALMVTKMRNSLKIFIILASLTQAAWSEDTKSISLDEITMFTSIIGGYSIERNCRFGSAKNFENFELSVRAIYKGLADRGTPKKRLIKIWKDASEISKVTPYSECTIEAKSAVSQSAERSWKWAMEIVSEQS